MSWKKILKQKPDYPDLDGDGDKEEPMVDALKTIEEVESTKKSPDNNRVPIGAKLVATYIVETTPEEDIAQLEQIQQGNRINKVMGIKGRPTKKTRRDLDDLLR